MKTVIPWLSQDGKCPSRRMLHFLLSAKATFTRKSNEYGKRITYAAQHTNDEVSEECLSNQKEFLFQ